MQWNRSILLLALSNLLIPFALAFYHGVTDIMASMDMNPDGSYMDYEWLHQNGFEKRQVPTTNASLEKIDNEYVTLPLDHFGDSDATFNNRYWVSEASYKPGGPIFVYDVGEANASTNGIHLWVLAQDREYTLRQRLRNHTSFFKQFMDEHHGMGIVWEHRFYGNSSPVNVSLNTPATAFEYLTTEQALADLPTFAWDFRRKNFPNVDLTPAGTPWIIVGGSYPGMRSAFMRKFYPGTIFAAYASSAPVQAAIDMSYYFEPIWNGMRAQGWTNCTNDIKAAVLAMDEIMVDPIQSAALKVQFLGRGAANNTNAGFADALSTIFFLWQSYGVDGGSQGLRSFCNWIERDTATNRTSTIEDGWAAVKGVNYTINRWATWPAFPATVNENLFTRCEGPNPRRINATAPRREPNCNLEERFPEPASISWTWQYCTQWGFLQSANLGEHQLVSKYNSLVHQRDICHRQFPDGLESGLLPDWPSAGATNARFGGWGIRPSNTFWTGGEWDPWRTLSPFSTEPFAPKFDISQEIPDCGGRFRERESDVFGYLVPDGIHAYDFRTTFNASIPARDLFNKALVKWLRCWQPMRDPGRNGTTEGGGSWGGGHYNPLTGSVGQLPDVDDEDGWLKKIKTITKTLQRQDSRATKPLTLRARAVRRERIRKAAYP